MKGYELMSQVGIRTFAATCFLAAAAIHSLPAHAQQQSAPPLVQQLNNGNWLPQQEAEALRDELYYQRAVHAYMTMLPALNVIGMRDGSEATFGKGYNILPIWKDRMDARAWVPTPNADVIYSMSYLDLKETGPLVVAAPPNVIGMFTDFLQRTITDVGLIGPDRARGGLYLLLPPDYAGDVPKGYLAFKSPTYNVFLFFRTVMKKGADAPDPAPAVALAEQTRVYPLWTMEKDVKPMQFPNETMQRSGELTPRQRRTHDHSSTGTPDTSSGTSLPKCRQEQRHARRGMAAPSTCSSASAASWSCVGR